MKSLEEIKQMMVALFFASVAMSAMADIAPSTDELVTEVIAKSLQSPVFLSFWLLWGGLAIVPLSMFVKRRLSRVTMVVIGVLMLTIGFVVGEKDYNRCGRCGTKLERWYYFGHHVACPKCNPNFRRPDDRPIFEQWAVPQTGGR